MIRHVLNWKRTNRGSCFKATLKRSERRWKGINQKNGAIVGKIDKKSTNQFGLFDFFLTDKIRKLAILHTNIELNKESKKLRRSEGMLVQIPVVECQRSGGMWHRRKSMTMYRRNYFRSN